MTSDRILFIVEGKVDEPKLLKHLNKVLNVNDKLKIFKYKNNVHHFIKNIYEEMKNDEYLDIKGLLKEKTTEPTDRAIFSKKYAAVYLIFDFEPHDPQFNINKLCDAQQFFADPCALERGLLILNYPMLEAFKHLKSEVDQDFILKTVTQDEVLKYKALVNEESGFTDYSKLDDVKIKAIIKSHLIKLNFLITGNNNFPSREFFLSAATNLALIRLQHNNYINNRLAVLSLFFYYLFELKNSDFYNSFNIAN